jgi:hypothetical protein
LKALDADRVRFEGDINFAGDRCDALEFQRAELSACQEKEVSDLWARRAAIANRWLTAFPQMPGAGAARDAWASAALSALVDARMPLVKRAQDDLQAAKSHLEAANVCRKQEAEQERREAARLFRNALSASGQ